jgi:hypothetical protein
MCKEINLIKSENLLNHLPLELEDMICEFLKEHPLKIELRKELNKVLEPYHMDEPWKKKWEEHNFYSNYKNCVRIMKRIKKCGACGKYKFSYMKNYDKNQRLCEKCGCHL